MENQLFIPGPTMLDLSVRQALGHQAISHRSKQASLLQIELYKKLQSLMLTKNPIILMTGAGSLMMEACVQNLSKDKTLVVSMGAFGDRWYDICLQNKIEVDLLRLENGEVCSSEILEQALAKASYDLLLITDCESSTGLKNPLEELSCVWKKHKNLLVAVDAISSLGGESVKTDAWGIDCCIGVPHKCLAGPSGLCFTSLSERALNRSASSIKKSYCLDFVRFYERDKTSSQSPFTPAVNLYLALDEALNLILKEGLEKRFKRHALMAERTKQFANNWNGLFGDERYQSKTVSCLNAIDGIDFERLEGALLSKGYIFSQGYGSLRFKTFRIAHMGSCSFELLEGYLELLNKMLENQLRNDSVIQM